jgi:hypothetical protein
MVERVEVEPVGILVKREGGHGGEGLSEERAKREIVEVERRRGQDGSAQTACWSIDNQEDSGGREEKRIKRKPGGCALIRQKNKLV